MHTSTNTLSSDTVAAVENELAKTAPRLHRIRTVRRQQGINLRGLSKKTGESLYELQREELERADLLLSRVYWWQRLLDVPAADLLVEPSTELSPRVRERARLVRIMKTVAALKERARGESVERLAEM